MDEIEYKGRKYTFSNGRWIDETRISVHKTLNEQLNKEFIKSINLKSMRTHELIQLGDTLKNAESYEAAVVVYKQIVLRGNESDCKFVFPKISSCLRLMHCSGKVLSMMEYINDKFGSKVFSPALLTSVAAAYCDVGDYTGAKIYADKAYRLSKSNRSLELILVYKRIDNKK